MNLTLNSLAPMPAAADPAPVAVSVPAADAQPGVAPAAFAQWLGLGRQADASALLAGAPLPAADSADAADTDAAQITDQPTAPDQQPPVLLTAAMSMPLMAPPQAPVVLRAAAATSTDEQTSEGEAAKALPLSAAELRTGLATASTPAIKRAEPAAPEAAPAGRVGAAGEGTRARAEQPQAAEARAATPLQSAAPAADTKPAADAAPAAAAAADRPAANWSIASAAPASTRLAADSTVTLAGPPTAWRQTLHEALGERLNLQLSNRAEHAVIRLEPPLLGRVDIAIRHSAGALEVTISATHGEVLRQLNAVSDNLRGDLAARQFTDVAVTVTQAPRAAHAAPQGDAQGRGRQPGHEQQPKDPGRALADAGDPAATFTLNGRA